MLLNSIRTMLVGAFFAISMIGSPGAESNVTEASPGADHRSLCWACWK